MPLAIIRKEVLPRRTVSFCDTYRGHRLIALVGQPGDPRFDSRSVVVRDHATTPAVELFEKTFDSHILAVRITLDYLVCSFTDRVEVLKVSDKLGMPPQPYFQCDTALTLIGPLAIFSGGSGTKLLFQGRDPRDITHVDLQARGLSRHHAADAALQLVRFATPPDIFATASQSGHVVKIWSTDTLQPQTKLRRGRLESRITDIDFSPDLRYAVVVSAARSKIHVFSLAAGGERRAFCRIRAAENEGAMLVSWFGDGRMAIMTRKGIMMLYTFQLEGETLREVGCEQANILQRVREKDEEERRTVADE